MNSPLNYEWEQLLDIDDFDLLLTHVLCPCNSYVRETSITTTTQMPVGIIQVEEKSIKIILSPAGIVQVAKLCKQLDIHEGEGGDKFVLLIQEYIRKVIDDAGEDKDFKGDIENYLKNGKLKQVVEIINSCTPNLLGDLTVTLKDLSCTIPVFSPKPSMHYLNITMRNMVKVFYKNTFPGNGSGVGGSRMLMEEEEIVKLMKEEEMVNLELQVCRDVTDQDEEALNLALEEEARQTRAAQEMTNNTNRRLIVDLEALGERGDAVRCLDHMREIVARDFTKLGVLEKLFAGTHVEIGLKDSYAADIQEKE
uniref:Uncharacterized protein n=1 Tax=Tanacetum cinerariifolium TaxID=118510 RepID=A0A6L2LUW4_TANCI|nr:hypothetical protein [Tanacetum cinerariifolium]